MNRPAIKTSRRELFSRELGSLDVNSQPQQCRALFSRPLRPFEFVFGSRWPAIALVATCLFLAGCVSNQEKKIDPVASLVEPVNPFASNQVVVPVNQVLTPAGKQVELPGMRPQALALSPDGRLVATSGKTHELVLIDPVTGAILQRVSLPSEDAREGAADAVSSHILDPDKEGQVSYTGLIFSPDGSRIFLSNVNGSIKVFAVGEDHHVTGLYSLPLAETGLAYRKKDIPSGLAMSSDGKRLYVALNVSNRLLELDVASGKSLRMFDVGTAPYAVVLAGHKAYVSNWGGRRTDGQSVAGPIGIGAKVRVDPVRFVASEGSVSVVDFDAGRVSTELMVGLHPSGLALSPDNRYVAVANANSDSVSVIETRSDRIVETISLRWQPRDIFGASPNALDFDRTGKTLFVCNGTQNAVALVAFRPGRSKLVGLLPTGWYPGAVVCDSPRRALYVANIKGLGTGKRNAAGEKAKFNSHQYFGTLSLMAIPDKKQLIQDTRIVQRNYQRAVAEAALLPARSNIASRPVPERVGEPSVFQHVVYIIKENRSYDQVLGDVKEGNGDPSLCVFGESVTPNQHKLVREFVLLDNTYCSGILSADGHQWTDTAFATDYMEKSFAGFPRSYPDGMEDHDLDALAYAPTGFIWDNAIEHGKTLRDYGEFAVSVAGWKDSTKTHEPAFLDYYRDFTQQTGLTHMASRPGIPSLTPHMNTDTVGWDLAVPDVFRAAQFIKDLRQFERDGAMPNLMIICLPNDHTSGTKPHTPTPAAQVADNDLAFGQIVEAISHSRFWKDTCIFAVEDDPQDGWDHVSGYRTTAYVVSPYTPRHKVIHENYNQTSILRTMELILGLPPMNQMDATATPMQACFSDTPDLNPYDAVPTVVPLDQMNPEVKAIHDPVQRKYAIASSKLPLKNADECPEDLLNRIIWHAQKGSQIPYPTWAIDASRKQFSNAR
jgi:YVTN family beta-propeller protein